ncbi:hypothetical protein M422DRAFT_49315 [Sphaerobolus stellatus SS14]|uniref:Glutamate decarboxylase n=1 Tax=Sphaerobolus stellatus (strain SS14) TaxID=990650 RepID=A0A0C9VFF8_SPHS4|nr:hypothetical protein M422DRAFT_49315 [Sphaerobolus stellatus SS14]
MNIEGFRHASYQAIDRICDYFLSLEERPVLPSVQPGFLRGLLPNHVPDSGEDIQQIADDFRDTILPESILGELYSSSIANPGFNWHCSPVSTELEEIVMDWSCKLLGLSDAFLNTSETGGGVLGTTACDSVLVTIVAARTTFLQLNPGLSQQDLVLYITSQTHILGCKAAAILGLAYTVLEVAKEGDYSLRGKTLLAAIKKDAGNGRHPFFLIATVGSTSNGSVDRIDELGPILVSNGIWMHVDAAWAGLALACPEYRDVCQLEAINKYADSFCINFHKWGLVSLEASALWVRNRQWLMQALDVTPEYLRTIHVEDNVNDYRNWQFSLSRRSRSLKMWFVLRGFGIQGLQGYIRKTISLCQMFYKLVENSSDFQLVGRPFLSLAVFRLRPKDSLLFSVNADEQTLNDLNRIFHRKLLIHDLFLTQTMLDGMFCIRFNVGATRTEERHIMNAWKTICSQIEPAIAEWVKYYVP